MMPYLSLAIFVPIVAGLATLVIRDDRDAAQARWIALIGALAGLAVTIPLWVDFDTTTAAMQFVERMEWVPRFDINYHLGVDGISMPFVLLNSFITVVVVWSAWVVIERHVAQYMAAFLIMSGLVNGAFAALDGALFYVFFEAMLIPMYLIIGIWGGPNRVYAALKFFLYTLLGSLLMLVALVYLYNTSDTFDILEWYHVPLSLEVQILLFIAFFLSFAV
jgi:NADH-quinone oxidoreductase subunit M